MTTEPDITRLLSDLQSDDYQVHNPAISAFRELKAPEKRDQALTELQGLLRHENPWFRLRAVFALDSLADPRAVQLLIETLNDEDEDAGQELIEARFDALCRFKDPHAIEPLIQQLHRVDFKQAWSLGAFGDAVILPLITALHHQNVHTRWQAAYYLGNAKDERAIPPLIESLKDPQPGVVTQAIYSLLWLKATSAVPDLIGCSHHDSPKIRSEVCHALGELGGEDARKRLAELVNDADETVRYSAAAGLGKLGDNSAISTILEALNAKHPVRRDAIQAVHVLNYRLAVPQLLRLMEHLLYDVPGSYPFDIEAIANALGDMGDTSTIVRLQPLLQDSMKHVQVAAQRAIDKLQTQ